jgi:hypothetical protein
MMEALVHVNWNGYGERRSGHNSRYGFVISPEEVRNMRRILRTPLHKTRRERGTFRIQGSDTDFTATTLSIANSEEGGWGCWSLIADKDRHILGTLVKQIATASLVTSAGLLSE